MARSFSRTEYIGDTISFTVNVTRNAAPVDLTGSTIWFTAKDSLDDLDAAAVFQKTIGAGVTLVDAAGGEIRVTVDPADTDTLDNEDATLECDLKVEEADGTTTTVLRGAINLLARVTRG